MRRYVKASFLVCFKSCILQSKTLTPSNYFTKQQYFDLSVNCRSFEAIRPNCSLLGKGLHMCVCVCGILW